MGKKLYVGNLPYSVTSASLQTIFQEVGTVESANVITDRDTGRSKGFGFVEMSTDEQAQEAIEKLNGRECEGRQLRVSEAQSKPQGGGGRGGFSNNGHRREFSGFGGGPRSGRRF